MLNMHVDLLKYVLKIYNTKIIESAKLIKQLITVFLKGIVHPKFAMWCLSAYPLQSILEVTFFLQ